jgi:biotin carboxyl carrier protein
MENEVHATRDGVVADLTVAPGQPVATGQAICRIVVDGTG